MFTLQNFDEQFPDNDSCLRYIFDIKNQGIVCEKCGKKNAYYQIRGTTNFSCSCGKNISALRDTLFSESRIKIRNWFLTLFIFARVKNITTGELGSIMGFGSEACNKVLQTIRKMILAEPLGEPHPLQKKAMEKIIEAIHVQTSYKPLYIAEMQFKQIHKDDDIFFLLLALALRVPYENLPHPSRD